MGLRMKGLLSGNKGLQFMIVTVAAVLCLMVWPFRVFYHEAVSEGSTGTPYYTGAVTMDEIVLQQFMPAGDYLASLAIGCSVENIHALDRVFVTIYDQDFAILYQEVPYFNEIEGWGEIRIKPEMDVIPGAVYYVGINVHYESVGTLRAAYAEAETLRIRECGALSYASALCEGMQLMMRFVYTKPFSTVRILCCIAGILTAAAALYAGIAVFISWLKKRKCWETVRRILIGLLFAAAAAGVLAAAWFLCIARLFGGGTADIAVYALAVLSILLVAGYACYRAAFHSKDQVSENTELRWRDYLQTISFAVLFWAGVRYTDAVIQWEQDLAACWLYLLFGVCVLLSVRVRALFHPLTLIWGLLMIPASMVYCHMNGVDEQQMQIARCLMAAVFVWGCVLMVVLRSYREQGRQRTCLPAAVCFLVLCVLMIVNRHGKSWPVGMAATCVLFYLVSYTEAEKHRLMHNFMNGIIVNFLWMWVMCLCFRPYHYYRFNRYPMYFHTVASTGMYLVMVEAVVIVRLLMKIKKSGTVWRAAWKEWLLQAVVLGYTALTVARTAFVAVGGMVVLLLVAVAIVYRPRWKTYLSALAAGLGTVILLLPAVYTLTRCIPAVVNRPVKLGDQEKFSETIVEGEKPDSPRYMNVEALFRLWGNRLGTPEMSEDRLSSAEMGDIWTAQMGMKSRNGSIHMEAAEAGGMRLTQLGTVASAGGTFAPDAEEVSGGTNPLDHVSNGRFGIYLEYFSRLNFSGHEEMGISDGGVEAMHAHNSFLQIAYDFGIPAGLLYLGILFGMFGRSVFLIWRGKDRSEMQFMTLVMLAAFILVSMFEYTANQCLPLGFASFFVLFTMRREKSILSLEDEMTAAGLERDLYSYESGEA
ncbi:MAG: hypothetical protein HDR15_11380 [Lachnospiraceae bacterium]|nr:hypothetical protein [Lachnospiraceae bacterium]